MIMEYENMTFEKFLALKSQWLDKMHLTWLIQGHLTAENAMNMVNVAENALAYTRISKDDINYVRLVKLNDRTIYSFEKSNMNPENPNSACSTMFAYRFDNNKHDSAVGAILLVFLEEPTFNTLRT